MVNVFGSFTSNRRAGWCISRALLWCGLLFLAQTVSAATSISILALFGDKALFQIDGEQRILHTGETSPEGVSLLGVDSGAAVIEVDGREEVLQLGFATTFPGSDLEPESAWSGPEKVSLWADSSGFFYSSGTINGFPVRFLVDTGATSVAFSSQLADRMGIDYNDTQQGFANTAGGMAQMFRVVLEKVTVGGITLHDVEAGVVVGSFPREPLLGMSFLGQLDMVREGDRMDLKRRF